MGNAKFEDGTCVNVQSFPPAKNAVMIFCEMHVPKSDLRVTLCCNCTVFSDVG